MKNYRPTSLFPVAGKIFEILYNNMHKFFTVNNLIFPNQPGFKSGDSCINQLLSITHEINKSFDNGLEVRGIFLDISKALSLHKGLLHKLKQNGISGKLFEIITNLLNFRKQRVFLNGQYSSWTSIEAGPPQGWILRARLVLIYINDLSDDLTTNVKLFADDTFSIVHNMNTPTINLKNDLNKIRNWTIQWNMNVNPDPSKQAQKVIFSRKL